MGFGVETSNVKSSYQKGGQRSMIPPLSTRGFAFGISEYARQDTGYFTET
jgi:hypothetical protein